MAEVALLDSINPSAREVFTEAGLEVVTFEKSVTVDELVAITDGVRILGVRSGPKVPWQAMSDSLEVIDVFGVGTNHIDRSESPGTARAPKSADERGIPIFNSAHENTRAVAELVMGSTFSLMRDIAGHNRAMHGGEWTKTDGQEVLGKTMGIVGYGAIGAQVSVLAETNGMDVAYFDPDPKIPPRRAAPRD
jgi:D-3-phosphoglycerate dehydrogenase / 2-oxoglutarate reductase